jgi:hypothetical protein
MSNTKFSGIFEEVSGVKDFLWIRRLFSFQRDPMVSRTFFARLQDRPAFRTSRKISHEKDDLQLLQKMSKKPAISSKT